MAGIKLNIGRSKSKQVVPECSRSDRTSVSKPDKNNKKKLFKSSRQGSGSNESSKHKDVLLDESDATDRTNFSEFTLEDGLFSSVDKARPTSKRPVCKELQVQDTEPERPVSRRGNNATNRQRSWIDSTWDGGSSFNFEDDANSCEEELDDSLYQLLDLDDDVDTPEQFKKLSLHNILVEEELSFQRSLVWNDDEK
jgi:hypothetical protein